MSYIGRQPLIGNFITCDALTASATTTYNLTSGGAAVSPQTAANCIVSLDGVTQAPTTAYTISGSTIIFSTALSSSNTIDYIQVLGNVLNIGTPTNGTVSVASLASGFALPATSGGTGTTTYTAGNILYASNATTLTTLAPGTSGYGLTLNGTTPAWTAPPTSDYVLLATTDVTSSTASVSFDGYFSSTYKNYKVIVSNFIAVTNNTIAYLRYRVSNADITSSTYVSSANAASSSSSTGANEYTNAWNTSYIKITGWGVGNSTTNGGWSFDVNIYNPLNTSSYKTVSAIGSGWDAQALVVYYSLNSGGININSTSALSGITFLLSSGNIASGNFKLYGLK